MIRSRYSTLVLWSTVVCGLGIAFGGQFRSQPARAVEKGGQLKEWEFPDAECHRTGNVGTVFAADYATSKSFEEVWTYYAKKLEYQQEYRPNLTYGKIGILGAPGPYQVQILNSSDVPAAAKVRRSNAKSATLIRRGSGGSVTIFISRAKDEDKTYFTLIVERN